ncbi:MAG: MBL fold metallo-hydrolase [Chloroflexi bacterium]|nr:MBL fold metallo-hydrolase [Chloroflexota bacterium]
MSTIFSGERWSVQRFVSGFANNAFLITCARTGKSVIVDTPANPDELIAAARETTVEAILITHGHQDHLDGFAAVVRNFRVAVGIGAADSGSLPGPVQSLPGRLDVSTGSLVVAGDITLRPMATPGHTPGSTCFMLGGSPGPDPEPTAPEDGYSHVFTGDTLFPGGPGRSASPQALRQMLESIKTHIFTLSGTTVVLPGHGEFTTVGASRREYAAFASKPLDANLSGDVTWA